MKVWRQCSIGALFISIVLGPSPLFAESPMADNLPASISAADLQTLRQQADRSAITELVNRYFDAAWRRDAETFLRELFAPDMEHVTVGASFAADGQLRSDSDTANRHVTKGAADLRELYTRALKAGPLPFGHNLVIDVLSSNEARGRVVVELRTINDLSVQQIVVYEDNYVKIDGQWKFRRRVGHAVKQGQILDLGSYK